MNHHELDTALRQTFADTRLSRPEQDALRRVITEFSHDEERLRFLRNRAFAITGESLTDTPSRDAVRWLESVIQTIDTVRAQTPKITSSAYFSPGNQCLGSVRQLISNSTKTMDLCIYTITDDRIKKNLIDAFERGVEIRVITDDGKIDDAGSDITALQECGMEIAIDTCNERMHHKFAIFDNHQLLSGSFNWTRSATSANYENLIVTNDPDLLAAFKKEFDRLWSRLPRLR